MKESIQTEIIMNMVKSTKTIREINHISIDEVNDILGTPQICEAIESSEWHINGKAITAYQLMTYLAIVNARIITFNNAPEEEIKSHRELDSKKQVDDFYKYLGEICNPNQ